MSLFGCASDEQFLNEIVNDKFIDSIKDDFSPSRNFVEGHRHYCKTCTDKVCCNKGQDRWAYCLGDED